MGARLIKGTQPLTQNYDASGGDVVTAQVLKLGSGVDYDVVIINNGNSAEGFMTSYACPSGTAIYEVDKDDDFACAVGDSYTYTVADNQLSAATTSGQMTSWVCVEAAATDAVVVKCQHLFHQAE